MTRLAIFLLMMVTGAIGCDSPEPRYYGEPYDSAKFEQVRRTIDSLKVTGDSITVRRSK